MHLYAILSAAFLLTAQAAAQADVPPPTADFTAPEPQEAMPGGSTTQVDDVGPHAFSHPSANMSTERRHAFRVGKGYFGRVWIAAPASNEAVDGLGPLFNARSCLSCHERNGRGHPPGAEDDYPVTMFLRLSVPPRTEAERLRIVSRHGKPVPEPTYGIQLQNHAIHGVPSEGRMAIRFRDVTVRLPGGETVELQEPVYSVADLGYGPLDPKTQISPRVAPQVIGLGLLESVAEADILSLADPDDADGDGISGRPNRVWSAVRERVMLGRFGWKAGEPSVDEQSQRAFADDMGISVPLHPAGSGDCTHRQTACRAAPNGNSPSFGDLEADTELTDLVVFYSRNLAVPARRGHGKPSVLAGKAIFYSIGCIGCHNPKFRTPSIPNRPEQSDQPIWPYTDLLLHDMGAGLADHYPEGQATGHEWRTTPLWGIGLIPTVNGHSRYLHDGRARNLQEAILWHGGEAKRSRDAFASLSGSQRESLLRFIESL